MDEIATWKPDGDLVGNIQLIRNAISSENDLEFQYKAKDTDVVLTRRVTPIITDGDYLLSYCHLRKDLRTFIVKRIRGLSVKDRIKPRIIQCNDGWYPTFFELLVNNRVCYYLPGETYPGGMEGLHKTENQMVLNQLRLQVKQISTKGQKLHGSVAKELFNLDNYCLRNPISRELMQIGIPEELNNQIVIPEESIIVPNRQEEITYTKQKKSKTNDTFEIMLYMLILGGCLGLVYWLTFCLD